MYVEATRSVTSEEVQMSPGRHWTQQTRRRRVVVPCCRCSMFNGQLSTSPLQKGLCANGHIIIAPPGTKICDNSPLYPQSPDICNQVGGQ